MSIRIVPPVVKLNSFETSPSLLHLISREQFGGIFLQRMLLALILFLLVILLGEKEQDGIYFILEIFFGKSLRHNYGSNYPMSYFQLIVIIEIIFITSVGMIPSMFLDSNLIKTMLVLERQEILLYLLSKLMFLVEIINAYKSKLQA